MMLERDRLFAASLFRNAYRSLAVTPVKPHLVRWSSVEADFAVETRRLSRAAGSVFGSSWLSTNRLTKIFQEMLLDPFCC